MNDEPSAIKREVLRQLGWHHITGRGWLYHLPCPPSEVPRPTIEIQGNTYTVRRVSGVVFNRPELGSEVMIEGEPKLPAGESADE